MYICEVIYPVKSESTSRVRWRGLGVVASEAGNPRRTSLASGAAAEGVTMVSLYVEGRARPSRVMLSSKGAGCVVGGVYFQRRREGWSAGWLEPAPERVDEEDVNKGQLVRKAQSSA